MSFHLKGVIPALLTPYNEDYSIDKSSLCRLIQFHIAQGMDGLYVGGSTAESFMQSISEREAILDIVAQEAKGKLSLIAHVGAISTDDSQKLAKKAHILGFDAVSAVTPFYYSFNFNEHCEHYKRIIDSAEGLPMVVYNIPAFSGVKLTQEQISTLLNLPNVIALKQTSNDLYQMEQIHRHHPDKIIYNGYDEIFLSGILAGAQGGIGSTYNVMGWRYKAILDAIHEGDISKAQQLQGQCNQIIDVLIKTGVFQGLKTILNTMGIISTSLCRRPFSPLNRAFKPELDQITEALIQEKAQQFL